ncbi:MAG: hypothetical protein A2984_01410 [Omnitrophica WOR_2 bacterium RIFCSPLOWO2_01_FULL_41_12]|nr:MAG: hypothetical protein A2984_01410 [Omnitrophica WOR_2 bacterium RIFCSPLOWO2_01_FULL_41_12]
MAKVNLLLGIHCHQPVGNFSGVFQGAYELAYLPFIETMAKHPEIKFSLHYSGSLLDWLKNKEPGFLKKINTLVKRGQVEIITGGYYEPILTLIDAKDAASQIEMHKEAVKELFSYAACGLWLTERVWEPYLPYILSQAGIKYTLVDDFHFREAGIEPENLNGYYAAEEKGKAVYLFPGSERLRYLLPFKLPQEIIAYLKNRLEDCGSDVAITFADDGEKFGLWPGTNKWVYREGWLEEFLGALEDNRDWIETTTFSQYINSRPVSGRVYLACASYREMMEWSDGNFRNFLVKYPEANNMYRKMWYVSNKIKELKDNHKLTTPQTNQLTQANRELYMGQDNDAYWHGVFGGLYLHHLRAAVYNHLIEAEKIVDNIFSQGLKVEELDFDLDGNNEIIVNSPQQNFLFKPSCQGALFEWDYKPKSLNFTNTIMRRYEKYHSRLKEKINSERNESKNPLSIHEFSEIKDGVSKADISYDKVLRYSLIEHFISSETKLEDFSSCQYNEAADFLNTRYAYKIISQGKSAQVKFWRTGKVCGTEIELIKNVSLNDGLGVSYELKNSSGLGVEAIFGVEFNLSVYDPVLSNKSGAATLKALTINDVWQNTKINFLMDKKTQLWYFPVDTISDSESGIERTYQELCLLFHWQIDLKPKDNWKAKIELKVI